MTAQLAEDFYVTPEEYLAREEQSETKHEYVAGMVYAMAGAGRAHNAISSRILGALDTQLLGKQCSAYGSDMRLRIRNVDRSYYYYPDITVDCSGSKENEVDEPTVIFEVLSPATRRADGGDKLTNYLNLPSMRAYALVEQSRAAITLYRRGANGAWAVELLQGEQATLDLPEIGCSLPLARIYAGVF